jgi:hypothetical protein
MFGNNKFDDILRAVKSGEELYVPIGGMGLTPEVKGNKKGTHASISDFLSIAKRRFRKSNPISPNQADYVNWVLYDRISFAPGAVIPQLTRLFVAPIGAGAKTKVDTNLELVSSLAAPQWFNCTGVSIYFDPNTVPIDLANFMHTEYMEFWVSQKVYLEGPLDVFPGSGGLVNNSWGNMANAATNFITNSTNGWPSIHNMYDVRLPAGLPLGRDSSGSGVTADGIIGITILQSQTFNIQMKADGGGATMAASPGAVPYVGVGLTVSARLHGILSRGVQ